MQPVSKSAVYQKGLHRFSGITANQPNDLRHSSTCSTINSDFSDLDIQQSPVHQMTEIGIAQILANKSSDLGGRFVSSENVASVEQIPQAQGLQNMLPDINQLVVTEVRKALEGLKAEYEASSGHQLSVLENANDQLSEQLREQSETIEQLQEQIATLNQRFHNVFGHSRGKSAILKPELASNLHEDADKEMNSAGDQSWNDRRQIMSLTEELYLLKLDFVALKEEEQMHVRQNEAQLVELQHIKSEIREDFAQIRQLVCEVLSLTCPDVAKSGIKRVQELELDKMLQDSANLEQELSFKCYVRAGNKVIEQEARFFMEGSYLICDCNGGRSLVKAVTDITVKYAKFISGKKMRQSVAVRLELEAQMLEILIEPSVRDYLLKWQVPIL